jgi:hypothetical protein
MRALPRHLFALLVAALAALLAVGWLPPAPSGPAAVPGVGASGSAVSFRAAAQSNANVTNPAVTVPAAAQPGDVMVLFLASASATTTYSTPAGWTRLDGVVNATATAQTQAYSRVAAAGDAGSTVTVPGTLQAKVSLDLVVYADAAGVASAVVNFDSTSSTSRTTPPVTVATDGSAVLGFWGDKSSDNTSWVLPSNVTQRSATAGSGGGRVISAVADQTGVAPGSSGSWTASTQVATARGMLWSVVIAPVVSTPTTTTTTSTTSTTAAAGVEPVSFRAAAQSNANVTNPTVTVPSAVQPGDVMVLFLASNSASATYSTPAGWTSLGGSASDTATVQTRAYTRIAAAGDAGSTLTVTGSAQTKVSVDLVAYADAAGVADYVHVLDTTSSASRTTPTATVAAAGSAALGFWGDKSSTNTSWVLPSNVTQRSATTGSGSGRVISAVADTLDVPAGTTGGWTASTQSATTRGMLWSVVIAPLEDPNPPATTTTTSTTTSTTTTSTTTTVPTFPSGTVAAWEHNEAAGASVLVDSSPNALNGTVGASVSKGLTDGSTVFHGRSTVAPDTSPYDPGRLATVPSATKLNPDTGLYAVTVRFRTTAPDGNMIQKGQSGTTGGYWKLEMNAGAVTCLFRGGDGSQRSVATPTALNDGTWKTLRCERTAAGVAIFVNGTQVVSRTGVTGNVANSSVFAIGGKASCNQVTVGCDYFSGDIDYVRVEAD